MVTLFSKPQIRICDLTNYYFYSKKQFGRCSLENEIPKFLGN